MAGLCATTTPFSLPCNSGKLLCIAKPRHAAVESASAEIDALRDYADRLGVQVTVHDGLNGIDLEWLCRRPWAPRGAGAAVLRALCSYADRAGQPVRLIVLAGRERLLTYYRRFGFEVVRSAENDSDSTELARSPVDCGLLIKVLDRMPANPANAMLSE